MKNIFTLVCTLLVINTSSCSQNKTQPVNKSTATDIKVGGPCEGCEAIYESPVAFTQLPNMVWLPDFNEKGTKLAINGTVYHADSTPAANVIIYIYHTDQTGVYPLKGNEKNWAKRHGYLRAWMRTNEKGEYKFFTLRPVPYPGRKDPAHIHITIKEPGKTAYWIDEFLFDDDPLLTAAERKKCTDRGGSGIISFNAVHDGKDFIKAKRDIYLGKNIPGYSSR